jgi:hypothetical protein
MGLHKNALLNYLRLCRGNGMLNFKQDLGSGCLLFYPDSGSYYNWMGGKML